LRWRWRYLLDAAVLLTCWFTTAVAIAYAALDVPSESTTRALYALVWLVGIGVDVMVLVRRSRPLLACLVTCGAALVLPLDSVAALIVLPWVITKTRPRVAWACAVLTAVVTAVALIRDWLRGSGAVLVATDMSGVTRPLPAAVYVVTGVVVVGAAVVRGVVQRLTAATAAADQVQREQQQAVENLRSELSSETIRQDERDLIARELHDTVAHHLSLVALRASALEVSSSPEAQETAREVRATAHDALEEMRDLISVLREGQLVPGPTPGRTLVDLPTLIDTVRAGGVDVGAVVYVSAADTAPRALGQVVYRIVQESLTNALKHAPGARVDLDVRAAPGFGVQLWVRNPIPDTPPGSGRGLVGMHERAAAIGGSVECGPVTLDDKGTCWQVSARLPWPTQD